MAIAVWSLGVRVRAIMARLGIGACLTGLCFPVVAEAAAVSPYTINVDPSYFGGKFGTSNTVQVYEIPLAVEYHGTRLRLRVEIPYVAVSGAGLISGGAVIQTNGRSVWRTGLGDIWAGADYRAVSYTHLDVYKRQRFAPANQHTASAQPHQSQGRGL